MQVRIFKKSIWVYCVEFVLLQGDYQNFLHVFNDIRNEVLVLFECQRPRDYEYLHKTFGQIKKKLKEEDEDLDREVEAILTKAGAVEQKLQIKRSLGKTGAGSKLLDTDSDEDDEKDKEKSTDKEEEPKLEQKITFVRTKLRDKKQLKTKNFD